MCRKRLVNDDGGCGHERGAAGEVQLMKRQRQETLDGMDARIVIDTSPRYLTTHGRRNTSSACRRDRAVSTASAEGAELSMTGVCESNLE